MAADPREILTRWAPGPDFTVRYGDLPEHIVDVRMPSGDPTGPLIIFIHGGFWMAEYDRTSAGGGPLAVDLAERGHPVATIEFRRIGQKNGGWRGTFDDVAAAVSATPKLIAEALSAQGRSVPDLDRPILAGHSAGGHLALWYAGQRAMAVRGVLALAPVADLVLAHRLGLGDGAVAALLGGGPDEVPDRYDQADPMRLLPLDVPAVLVHGADDDRVPVEVGRSYQEAAQRSGQDVRLVELPDTEHFALIDPRSEVWSTVLSALRRLR